MCDLTLHIPSEILAEIFIVSANGSPVQFPPNFFSPHWALSRVCRRWRSVASNESRFWNYISIISSKDALHDAKSLEFALKTLPDHGMLRLSAIDKSSEPDSSFSTAVMNRLVLPNLFRLKTLRLHLQSTGYPLLFTSPADIFASIEQLDLSFDFFVLNSAIAHASQDTSIFDSAHNLKALSITSSFGPQSVRFGCNLMKSGIPWTQLTALDFRPSPLGIASLRYILRQTKALETFTASVADYPQSGIATAYQVSDFSPLVDGEADDNELLVLPHLKTLSLWLAGGKRIFHHLYLPALTHLHLEGIFYPTPYTSISEMLSRSQCRLSVFRAGGRASPDTPAMHELMRLLPEVREFSGRGLMVEESTLRMVGSGEVMPNLEVLECFFEGPKTFLEALEMRLKLSPGSNTVAPSGVTPLKVAAGQCPRMGRCSEPDVSEVVARLEKLNERFNTNYTLEWMSAPSRDL